jgi:UDP-GlcNAc:undecaprenyl-phosphate GlcNAc-1-phosphate transferase
MDNLILEQIILCVLISFLTVQYCIKKLIIISNVKELFDHPDKDRKLHQRAVSPLGGVALFIGVMISISLNKLIWLNNPEFSRFFVAFVIIFFFGLKDDFIPIPSLKKLLVQFFVASIVTYDNKFLLSNLQGLFGIYTIPIWVCYFLTILAIVFIINAYNLVDGADGLAGTLGFFSALCFGIYFLLNGYISYAILALSLSSSLFSFLFYNFEPAKIFMGDSGSMLTGIIISILAIKFVELAPSASNFPLPSSLVVGAGIILFPIMDMFRVFFLRIFTGHSPFKADRKHAHHLLMDKGLTQRTLVTLILLITILFIPISLYLSILINTTYSFIILVFLFFIFLKLILTIK